MTKKEFLDELSKELEDLNKEERTSALKYYEDYFEDAGKENEQDVIKELGTPKKVAEVIKKENNVHTVTKETSIKREPLPMWIIILIAVFFIPVGIPLIVGFFGAIFGLFAGLIGVFIGFIGASLGIFVSGIATVVLGIVTAVTMPIDGLLLLGLGFILLSIGSVFTMLTVKLCVVVIPAIIRGIVQLGKTLFGNRGVK